MPTPLVARGGHDSADSGDTERAGVYQHLPLENLDSADDRAVLPDQNAPISVAPELKWRDARRRAPVDYSGELGNAKAIALVDIVPGAQFNRNLWHSGKF